MVQYKKITLSFENFATAWANDIQCKTVQFFSAGNYLVLLFVLAASHPILITTPLVTVQIPLESIKY